MRARPLARVLVAAAVVAHTGAPAPAGAWPPGVRRAIAYAHTRAGAISFEVRSRYRRWGWRMQRTVPSASVLKAMLLVAYLDDPRVRDRDLDPSDHRLLDPMIQESDNDAASAVLGYVGPAEVDGLARRAHMRRFSLVTGIWGNSRIDADDQARFFLHIDALVVARHRHTAMHLLATVTPSQRWGIGRLRLKGWHVYFKGGWGSGTGAVEHQVALLVRGRHRISAAVLITNSPSHAYAKATLRGLFSRLLHGLPRSRRHRRRSGGPAHGRNPARAAPHPTSSRLRRGRRLAANLGLSSHRSSPLTRAYDGR